ncbi:MAG: hypothetical protein RR276_08830, partial [Angelakisella sp.]
VFAVLLCLYDKKPDCAMPRLELCGIALYTIITHIAKNSIAFLLFFQAVLKAISFNRFFIVLFSGR